MSEAADDGTGSSGEQTRLTSFGSDINAAVVGANGAIGSALVGRLQEINSVSRVITLSRSPAGGPARQARLQIDIEDEGSIAAAADETRAAVRSLDLVIVAIGVLHGGGRMAPEKTWKALSPEAMQRAFRVNTIGPALVAKHFLPLLAKGKKSAFAALSARVGSIGDNRLGGWHSYRASKAALNMVIKTLAIELERRNPDAFCVGLHPGTVDSLLSRPFQRGVPADRLFSPEQSAGYLLNVLDGLRAGDSGRVFAWDGRPIPA